LYNYRSVALRPMNADFAQPELTEFRQKIELLGRRGIDAMTAKRIVASDRIARSERKSRGLVVYGDLPCDVEPAVDSTIIRKHWRELRSMVKHYDESLASLLVSCGVVQVRGTVVTLGTHVDKVAERLKFRRELLEQALCDLWQHEFQIEVVWAERAYWLDERWMREG
jgi:hypothetical protein